jgi:hypothetical protein
MSNRFPAWYARQGNEAKQLFLPSLQPVVAAYPAVRCFRPIFVVTLWQARLSVQVLVTNVRCQNGTHAPQQLHVRNLCVHVRIGRSCGIFFAGLLRARKSDIRGHVGAHLSVSKKCTNVYTDGGVQSEVRSCGQCSEGRGERSCCEGSGGLSDSGLENQRQGCAPNPDLVKTCSLDRILEDLSIRPTEWCQQPIR